MRNGTFKILGCLAAVSLLAACGGSSATGSFAQLNSRLVQFQNDPSLGSMASQSTVDVQSGAATYDGVVNIGVVQPGVSSTNTRNYLGEISMTVNFGAGADAVSGTADSFVFYGSMIASPDVGSSVPGSLTFSGTTTVLNESLGDGIMGTMTGAIEGVDTSGTFDGNITGVNANGMSLFLDGPGLGGGVALLVD